MPNIHEEFDSNFTCECGEEWVDNDAVNVYYGMADPREDCRKSTCPSCGARIGIPIKKTSTYTTYGEATVPKARWEVDGPGSMKIARRTRWNASNKHEVEAARREAAERDEQYQRELEEQERRDEERRRKIREARAQRLIEKEMKNDEG